MSHTIHPDEDRIQGPTNGQEPNDAPTDPTEETKLGRDPYGDPSRASGMTTRELDKETYRQIVKNYFRAFGAKDFGQVQFSPHVQFLSPLSGTPVTGRNAVSDLVRGVSGRVSAVHIISTAVDFPTASGVWQMTTTKGVAYTLHNFFRLDGEGLVYIWPMFDPKAVMSDPAGFAQWLSGNRY